MGVGVQNSLVAGWKSIFFLLLDYDSSSLPEIAFPEIGNNQIKISEMIWVFRAQQLVYLRRLMKCSWPLGVRILTCSHYYV